MYYKIAGVDNFSCCCDFNIRVNFENTTHSFSHYFDISLNKQSKNYIRLEGLVVSTESVK